MENEFVTLNTIYDIVKNDPNPITYLCSAREIILRQLNDWDTIREHLKILEENEFVVVKHLDKIAISITRNGINRIKDSNLNQGPLTATFNDALIP